MSRGGAAPASPASRTDAVNVKRSFTIVVRHLGIQMGMVRTDLNYTFEWRKPHLSIFFGFPPGREMGVKHPLQAKADLNANEGQTDP